MPVSPRQPGAGPRLLTFGDGKLMAQHQDLCVLPPRLAPRQVQHRHRAEHDQEDQLQAHKPKIIPRPGRPRPARPMPNAGPNRPRSSGRLPRWHRFSAPTSRLMELARLMAAKDAGSCPPRAGGGPAGPVAVSRWTAQGSGAPAGHPRPACGYCARRAAQRAKALARRRLRAVAVDAKTSRGGRRADGFRLISPASPDTAGTSRTTSARAGMQLDHAVLAALALGV
jgi:hypothetical protein